jgi:hypothetical protein
MPEDTDGSGRNYRAAFEEGQREARVSTYGDAILRAFIVGGALAIAWVMPVAWYWKILLFAGIMFVAGIIVPAIKQAKRM